MIGVRLKWILAALFLALPTGCAHRVLTGVDVLVETRFAALEGQRVAILTNRTGRSSTGRRTIDLLHEAPGVDVVRLLSPEHGLSTDREGKVGDATDRDTGLPVFSLYGETRRPTAAMLADIDAVVFDVQDIGARFYTYITTLGYLMEECAVHGVRVLVLDRPNPIAPAGVDGPSADLDRLDFIAYRSIPVTHALTVGELARWFNAEFDLECDLQVIAMTRWTHAMWWDDCSLPWINPSPNIRNATQALLYPGLGLLEATNLSVGRGTASPFERIGAPWVDGLELALELNRQKLPGVGFTPIVYTPTASVHADQRCEGVSITVVDRELVRPVVLGLTIGWVLEHLYADQFEEAGIMRLMKNQRVMDWWRHTDAPQGRHRYPLFDRPSCWLHTEWFASVWRFEKKTRPYRLYP